MIVSSFLKYKVNKSSKIEDEEQADDILTNNIVQNLLEQNEDNISLSLFEDINNPDLEGFDILFNNISQS